MEAYRGQAEMMLPADTNKTARFRGWQVAEARGPDFLFLSITPCTHCAVLDLPSD